jgi:hypothetical protein
MCSGKEDRADKFVAMATAKVEVDLRLSDFIPRSQLFAIEGCVSSH